MTAIMGVDALLEATLAHPVAVSSHVRQGARVCGNRRFHGPVNHRSKQSKDRGVGRGWPVCEQEWPVAEKARKSVDVGAPLSGDDLRPMPGNTAGVELFAELPPHDEERRPSEY